MAREVWAPDNPDGVPDIARWGPERDAIVEGILAKGPAAAPLVPRLEAQAQTPGREGVHPETAAYAAAWAAWAATKAAQNADRPAGRKQDGPRRADKASAPYAGAGRLNDAPLSVPTGSTQTAGGRHANKASAPYAAGGHLNLDAQLPPNSQAPARTTPATTRDAAPERGGR